MTVVAIQATYYIFLGVAPSFNVIAFQAILLEGQAYNKNDHRTRQYVVALQATF